MQKLVIVNRGSGTVRSLGAESVKKRIKAAFAGTDCLEVLLVEAGDVGNSVNAALRDGSYDTIYVGGGDGTIAGVASQLTGTGIALGILPLGTMNMLAQAIELPANLEAAIKALSEGNPKALDVGRVNEKVFLHQVSFGLQPRVVRLREKIGYSSRLTKILSGMRAILSALARPRRVRMISNVDGKLTRLKVPALAVSNNLYRADRPSIPVQLDGGTLGVYAVSATRLSHYLRIALAVLRGRWKDDDMVQVLSGRRVQLTPIRPGRNGKLQASIDGELGYLDFPIVITIEPRALNLIVPKVSGA